MSVIARTVRYPDLGQATQTLLPLPTTWAEPGKPGPQRPNTVEPCSGAHRAASKELVSGGRVDYGKLRLVRQAVSYAVCAYHGAWANATAASGARHPARTPIEADALRGAAERYRWVYGLGKWINSIGLPSADQPAVLATLRSALQAADQAHHAAWSGKSGGGGKPKTPDETPDEPKTCPPGEELVAGRCVQKALPTPTCKADEELVAGRCVQKEEPVRAGFPLWGAIAAMAGGALLLLGSRKKNGSAPAPAIAGEIARCAQYGIGPRGEKRCITMTAGPGRPDEDARAAAGITRAYRYQTGKAATRGQGAARKPSFARYPRAYASDDMRRVRPGSNVRTVTFHRGTPQEKTVSFTPGARKAARGGRKGRRSRAVSGLGGAFTVHYQNRSGGTDTIGVSGENKAQALTAAMKALKGRFSKILRVQAA